MCVAYGCQCMRASDALHAQPPYFLRKSKIRRALNELGAPDLAFKTWDFKTKWFRMEARGLSNHLQRRTEQPIEISSKGLLLRHRLLDRLLRCRPLISEIGQR